MAKSTEGKGWHIRQALYGFTVYKGSKKIEGPFEYEYRAQDYLDRMKAKEETN